MVVLHVELHVEHAFEHACEDSESMAALRKPSPGGGRTQWAAAVGEHGSQAPTRSSRLTGATQARRRQANVSKTDSLVTRPSGSPFRTPFVRRRTSGRCFETCGGPV